MLSINKITNNLDDSMSYNASLSSGRGVPLSSPVPQPPTRRRMGPRNSGGVSGRGFAKFLSGSRVRRHVPLDGLGCASRKN